MKEEEGIKFSQRTNVYLIESFADIKTQEKDRAWWVGTVQENYKFKVRLLDLVCLWETPRRGDKIKMEE